MKQYKVNEIFLTIKIMILEKFHLNLPETGEYIISLASKKVTKLKCYCTNFFLD